MLNLGDLATLIRLTEIEIHELQKKIDGPDDEDSSNAAEIIIHTDTLSEKLKDMYLKQWNKDCGYPEYEKLLETYKKYPPFH